jgi:hypothetical protein
MGKLAVRRIHGFHVYRKKINPSEEIEINGSVTFRKISFLSLKK